jgi:hypothetical protein
VRRPDLPPAVGNDPALLVDGEQEAIVVARDPFRKQVLVGLELMLVMQDRLLLAVDLDRGDVGDHPAVHVGRHVDR